MSRRVVVTGVGIITALGEGTAPFWEALQAGRSGIAQYASAEIKTKPWCWGGEVQGFDGISCISPKQKKFVKVMSRDIKLSLVACRFAMEDSGLTKENISGERFGLSLGASLINNDINELAPSFFGASENGKLVEGRYGASGMEALTPLWMLKYLPNMPACHISINYDLQGPSNTITTEATSALQAIGEGFRIIQRGSADCMVVGATDSKVNPMAISRYHLLGLYANGKAEKPEDCFQPFSETVSGFLPGEAAAMLILEERERALARKAKIYGEVLGYGSSPLYEYEPKEAKDAEGRYFSMRNALREAGLSSNDLDFIYAHGCGLSSHDRMEKEAIRKVSGDTQVPVTFLKTLTGYLAAASGAVEMVAAALAIKNRLVPAIPKPAGKLQGLNFLTQHLSPKKGKKIRGLVHATSLVGSSAALAIGEHAE
jgi:3-oxoacyl-[acyl-carrier-protein] synthase II